MCPNDLDQTNCPIPGAPVPSAEILARIDRLRHELRAHDMDGMFIVQRVDLFYFSGTAQSGFLYVPAEGEPLLMIKRYAPRARQESPIDQIVQIRSVKEIPLLMVEVCGGTPKRLGFEKDVVPAREFEFYKALFPGTVCLDGSPLVHRLRMIKSGWELDRMALTAGLSAATFEFMRKAIRPGYTEMEFGGMAEAFARKMGHGGKLRVRDYQTEGYPWHILSGESGGMVGVLDSPASGQGTSPAFPCGAGYRKIAAHEPIMIDFALVMNGYHMDETRMFSVGPMPEESDRACRAAIDIHDRVLDAVRPGVRLGELFDIATARAEALGVSREYLGPPGYKVSFIGHGIGLELVEHPVIAAKSDVRLEPGMVFALEPKMVFEGRFTAGIESVFAVTESGRRLVSQTPVDVFIV